jgi:hypothetical protein
MFAAGPPLTMTSSSPRFERNATVLADACTSSEMRSLPSV